jgi:integrase
MTGLRQSELLGLRWRDVDWVAQRIRVRNTFVRGEHSTDGKSDLSTRRSVPMADRLAGELDRWSQRTEYRSEGDLVFAHPQTGSPLDRWPRRGSALRRNRSGASPGLRKQRPRRVSRRSQLRPTPTAWPQ